VALLERLQTDRSLARYAGWFVPLKIETNGAEWAKWSRQYRAEGQGIPIIYVIRADGKQLFGRSGSLPGLELPVMIQQVLSQAGTIYSDQQLQLLGSTLEKAKLSFDNGDNGAAVQEFSKLRQFGPLGKLGSHAKVALDADKFAETLIEQGKGALAAAKEKLAQEDSRLEGALALMATRRLYLALTPLKEDILATVTETRTNDDLRDMLKHAEKLDQARVALEKPGSKRRALLTLRRITKDDPGTPGASLAAEWIREHFPEESVDSPDKPAPPPKPEEVPPESDNIHTWTSDNGHKVEATLVGYGYAETTKAPYVVLKTRDGKEVNVPFARLSGDSQELAKELVRRLREAESKD
jgi:hypothetical protein